MTMQVPMRVVAPPSDGFEGSPGSGSRIVDWVRRNLFSSISNTLLTLLVVAAFALIVPPVFNWAIADATISGSDRSACSGVCACWSLIRLRLPTFFWGHYPDSELWRLALAAALMVAFSVPVLRGRTRHRGLSLLLLLTVFPLLAGTLLIGGVPGLPYVDTSQWGGLMLDIIISFVTVAGALPFGILLALGRRSELGVVRSLSIAFIELWRGVPLLTVLFMSAVMLPLFLGRMASAASTGSSGRWRPSRCLTPPIWPRRCGAACRASRWSRRRRPHRSASAGGRCSSS